MYLSGDYDDLYQKIVQKLYIACVNSISINIQHYPYMYLHSGNRVLNMIIMVSYGCFLWIYITVSAWISLEMSSKLQGVSSEDGTLTLLLLFSCFSKVKASIQPAMASRYCESKDTSSENDGRELGSSFQQLCMKSYLKYNSSSGIISSLDPAISHGKESPFCGFV